MYVGTNYLHKKQNWVEKVIKSNNNKKRVLLGAQEFYQYILVVTEAFTKYAWAMPTRDLTASATAIDNYWSHPAHGVPRAATFRSSC